MNVIICFVCYINTVSRLLIELFYYNVCYSGLYAFNEDYVVATYGTVDFHPSQRK